MGIIDWLYILLAYKVRIFDVCHRSFHCTYVSEYIFLNPAHQCRYNVYYLFYLFTKSIYTRWFWIETDWLVPFMLIDYSEGVFYSGAELTSWTFQLDLTL